MNGLYPDRMGERRPKPESVLAWAAAFVGAIGIASALTPELANRYDLVQGVLPPGVPTAARVFALAFGIALVFMSRSLARRRRRAWQLAVAVVVASAVAHLAKGLDFEEATISLVLLAALLRYRRRFVVPGDPTARAAARRPRLRRDGRDRPDARHRAARRTSCPSGWATSSPPRASSPASTRSSSGCARSRRRSRRRWGSGGSPASSSSGTAATASRSSRLRRDKSFFFSPTRRAFLAYRVVGGAALVSGDPVGDEAEFDALLAEFRRVAHARGWRLADRRRVLRAPAALPAARDARDPDRRRGRSAARRVLARGALDPEGAPVGLALDEGRVQRFASSPPTRSTPSCARSSTRSPPHGAATRSSAASRWRWTTSSRRAPASRSRRRATAPSAASSTSRPRRPAAAGRSARCAAAAGRRTGSPSSSSSRRSLWAKDCAATEVSLNFCALTDFLSPERAVTLPRRVLRRALLAADNVFQLERLHSFSRKFHPGVADALSLRRAADRPAARRARVSARRAAPRRRLRPGAGACPCHTA